MIEDPILIEMLQEVFQVAAMACLPLLVAVLLGGLVAGAFQTATSIQDAALGQVARFVSGGLALALSFHWVLSMCFRFMESIYSDFTPFLSLQG